MRCFIALLLVASASSLSASEARIKNLVFILVDDLGWKDLGCYGSTFHKTPHLDRLAATGMRFTDAYAASPVCSPTRAAIMTGRHPARVGITDWIPGQQPKNRPLLSNVDLDALPLERVTIAEALREHDFRTFFAGKWHLGGDGFLPEDQGFDINKGGHHKGSPPGGYYSPYKNPKLLDGDAGEYLPDRLTDESINFLREAGDDRFFLFLSFYTVHTPIQADKQSLDQFKEARTSLGPTPKPIQERDGSTRARQDRADYASMVSGMDRNVGRLLKALDELDLADSTAVIFTSDNGGLSTLAKRRNPPTCNLPLRAGKGWCYEGGIRVPLIIHAPGITAPGGISSQPIVSMDFYPTILSMLELPPEPSNHIDGVDLTSVLRNGSDLNERDLVWYYPHYHGSMWTPGAAIRAGKWKLMLLYETNETELFDLSTDFGERNNLAKTNPTKCQELRTRLTTWLETVDAGVPLTNPNYSAK